MIIPDLNVLVHASNRQSVFHEPVHRGGRLVNDAHLAALAVEHGGTIYSQDTDFAAFPGVRWVNPLA